MKQRFPVWLAPDGDNRLQALQASLAHASGRWEFLARPPFLVVPEGGLSRHDPLETGAWREDTPGLELELWSHGHFVGGLRLSEPWQGSAPELAGPMLPPPPCWSWKKGRLAMMTAEVFAAPFGVEWTLDELKGWKLEAPKA